MHVTQSVMSACMNSPRVHQFGKAQLPDVPHPLNVGVLQQFENHIAFDGNEPVYRIIDDFIFVQISG